jgi:hypothetical protein
LISGDLSPETLGTTELIFAVDGAELTVYVTVVDTKVPQAEPNHVKSFACYPLEADLFVKNIVDGSQVTCTFQVKPDWTKVGTQDVVILLTDSAGNMATVNSKITMEKDTEPLVITGLMERFTYLNEAVSYLKEIRATDNFDKNVSITVDSEVNIRQTGSYKVTFIATDMAGNTTRASTTFTVIEATITDEEIKEMADKVLYGDATAPGIINDSMTTAETRVLPCPGCCFYINNFFSPYPVQHAFQVKSYLNMNQGTLPNRQSILSGGGYAPLPYRLRLPMPDPALP